MQVGKELLDIRDCDEQASGGLRVVQDCAKVFGDFGVIFDCAFGEIAVVIQAAGDVALGYALESALEEGNRAG